MTSDAFSFFVDRDAYDLQTALEKDLLSLRKAFGKNLAPPQETNRSRSVGRLIQGALAASPTWKGSKGSANRPLLNPHRKDLHGRRLWTQTGQLLALGPEEHLRRLRAQERRAKDSSGWSR